MLKLVNWRISSVGMPFTSWRIFRTRETDLSLRHSLSSDIFVRWSSISLVVVGFHLTH